MTTLLKRAQALVDSIEFADEKEPATAHLAFHCKIRQLPSLWG
jgi:hypothetical protein